MIVSCVYITVKSDSIDRFIDATIANCRESTKEPGNLRFDFIQMSNDPTKFMLYEAYESEQDAANHKLTLHYATWKSVVADYMADVRTNVKYKIIEPEDPSQW